MTLEASLPIPPLEMRQLVGPTDPAAFDNDSRSLVVKSVPAAAYAEVFDFGCGCGRVARQLIQQEPRPRRYVGIDLHRGMVDWCKANLAPHAPGFEFHHHDVFNLSFNPSQGRPLTAPFPVEDATFSLVLAWSVFTHLTEAQAPHYLGEVARILKPDGIFHSTWLLFDKRDFPFMSSTNALYVGYVDPTAAVMYDRRWVREAAAAVGLTITEVVGPAIRGYQWEILMTPQRVGVTSIEIPEDQAPRGHVEIPAMPSEAHRIGTPD